MLISMPVGTSLAFTMRTLGSGRCRPADRCNPRPADRHRRAHDHRPHHDGMQRHLPLPQKLRCLPRGCVRPGFPGCVLLTHWISTTLGYGWWCLTSDLSSQRGPFHGYSSVIDFSGYSHFPSAGVIPGDIEHAAYVTGFFHAFVVYYGHISAAK